MKRDLERSIVAPAQHSIVKQPEEENPCLGSSRGCAAIAWTRCVSVCQSIASTAMRGRQGEFPNQLFINPDECIDCGACEPECPWQASSKKPLCLNSSKMMYSQLQMMDQSSRSSAEA